MDIKNITAIKVEAITANGSCSVVDLSNGQHKIISINQLISLVLYADVVTVNATLKLDSICYTVDGKMCHYSRFNISKKLTDKLRECNDFKKEYLNAVKEQSKQQDTVNKVSNTGNVSSMNSVNSDVHKNHMNQLKALDSLPIELKSIYFRGNLYTNPSRLCKQFNCTDVNKFMQLYLAGYPTDICLGLSELKEGTAKPTPRIKNYQAVISNKGALWNSTTVDSDM